MQKERINLYLDDLRDCPEGFKLARTVAEAKAIMRNNTVDIVSLDHDLGVDQDGQELENGYDFVKWFCEEGIEVEKIYLHTDNPVGRDNMYSLLKASQRREFIPESIAVYPHPCVPNRYSGE